MSRVMRGPTALVLASAFALAKPWLEARLTASKLSVLLFDLGSDARLVAVLALLGPRWPSAGGTPGCCRR